MALRREVERQFHAAFSWIVKEGERGIQAKIAREIGVEPSYINRIAPGDRPGSEEVLYDHLDCWYGEDMKDGIRYIVHYHGHRVDSNKKAWKEAKKRARVTRRLRLYDLRHAFATDLLRKGASLKTVSELLGHSDPGITAKVYQHVSASEQKEAINLLE